MGPKPSPRASGVADPQAPSQQLLGSSSLAAPGPCPSWLNICASGLLWVSLELTVTSCWLLGMPVGCFGASWAPKGSLEQLWVENGRPFPPTCGAFAMPAHKK